MKKIFAGMVLLSPLLMGGVAEADTWNNGGAPVTTMYVYPTYAVVVQVALAASSGPAGSCVSSNAWTVVWSDFDVETQKRIMAMLVSSQVAGKSITTVISSAGCGPENIKKSTGQLKIE